MLLGQLCADATGFNVNDLVIDVFYWFDKSTKRKSNLSDYCDFCNTTYRDIMKHVNTRWLSLERAVGRVLQQYAALKSYFASEHDANPRFLRLQKLFADPMTEVYLYFYQATLQTFAHFNQFLQREDPIISLVDQQIQSFLTKRASKFLTINTIKAAKSDLTKLKFDTSVQLPDGRIFVGMITKTQLTKLFAEGGITHTQYSKFFKGVREFYMKPMGYALSNLPMNEVLTNAKFVNVMSRDEASITQVEYFVECFSNLLPYSSPQEHDKLGEELIEYQLLDDSEIPESGSQQQFKRMNQLPITEWM